jgi:hypothetical protein
MLHEHLSGIYFVFFGSRELRYPGVLVLKSEQACMGLYSKCVKPPDRRDIGVNRGKYSKTPKVYLLLKIERRLSVIHSQCFGNVAPASSPSSSLKSAKISLSLFMYVLLCMQAILVIFGALPAF